MVGRGGRRRRVAVGGVVSENILNIILNIILLFEVNYSSPFYSCFVSTVLFPSIQVPNVESFRNNSRIILFKVILDLYRNRVVIGCAYDSP